MNSLNMDSNEHLRKLASINNKIAVAEKALDMMPCVKDTTAITESWEHYADMSIEQALIGWRELELLEHLDRQLVIRKYVPLPAKLAEMVSKRQRLERVAHRRAELTELCCQVTHRVDELLASRDL